VSTHPETRVVGLPDGRRLAYVQHGDPDGTPVLFFHGTPASRLGNDFTEDPAGALGLRVIVPDRPGIGRSDPKPDRTILSWAHDAAALADALNVNRFGVVGYSGGGPYVLACAQQLADRLLGAATMAGVGPLDRAGAREGLGATDAKLAELAVRTPRRARLELRVMAFGARLSPRSAISSFAKEAAPADEAVIDEMEDLDFFVEACRGGARGALLDYQLWAQPWDLDWPSITFPIGVFQGTVDTMVPVGHAEDLVARLPNATLHLLDNEGHMSIQTRVGEILQAAAGGATRS
jgi:pimeloyl-ACP methyl ester carboxylesterase